jgi:hypothetical protein
MINEEIRVKNTIEAGSIVARDLTNEALTPKFKGEVLDYFIYPNGNKELIREMDYNVVVNNCSVLIAALMKGHSGYSGATYWAVGSGNEAWPSDTPGSPAATDSQLVTETFRKAIVPATDIVFLDGSNNVSATPTNKIQVTVTFLEEEANGALMEFGIFGGNATGTANSGVMINHKTHPLIYKTNVLQLQRILRLTF